MPTVEPYISHAAPFVLVVFRLAGLLVFTPVLANRGVPAKFRALLAVMLGAAVYPVVPGSFRVAPDAGLADLVPLILSETLIGVVIGFIAGLPVLAMDMAGFLMGHQMGLSLARVYNPEVGQDSDIFGQVLMYITLGSFLAMGGLEAAFLATASTFETVPMGALSMSAVPLDTVVGLIASGMELALRVAMPILAIIFLLLIGLGFVMKTMPQINVMSVGFTVKIIAGIAMLAASLTAMRQASSREIEHALKLAIEWAGSLG